MSTEEEKPDVIAIHRDHAWAALDNGAYVPVTHWFGLEGEECSPDMATHCIAGNDKQGWFVTDLVRFCPVTVH